jgi:hypothetical protein
VAGPRAQLQAEKATAAVRQCQRRACGDAMRRVMQVLICKVSFASGTFACQKHINDELLHLPGQGDTLP